MEDFFSDIADHIQKYYYKLVDITPKIGLAILIFLMAWFIASKVQQFSDKRLKRRMHDPLLANFISRLVKAVLLIIGILIVFRIIGLNGIATSLLAGAGISAFVIGFALKDIGENFLAGILLAFKRPFSIGEIIESNGVKGKVISLNLRDTQIKSDGKDIYIPNALLIKNTLINYNSGGFLLQDFTINLEYGADYQKAIEIITAKLTEIDEVINEKLENSVVVSAVTGNTVQVTTRYWVKTDADITNGNTRSKVLIQVMEALKSHGYNLIKL
ncbi:mechanosensitive ion channel family protein [Flavobacterium pallidum]|uniref:Mechanosensitive ion channel protein MscS n=1 Tax=Flavobacterium pallidum TaxID=2172098 RepID=A0A2S1SH30_9FLAO|nr:mechanosensitive ion channel domain-containing protein [Flavobacterium pallidum]AWI25718.1 mechanosensitive ion channel protein MscS [Flavobacterium pallidum]